MLATFAAKPALPDSPVRELASSLNAFLANDSALGVLSFASFSSALICSSITFTVFCLSTALCFRISPTACNLFTYSASSGDRYLLIEPVIGSKVSVTVLALRISASVGIVIFSVDVLNNLSAIRLVNLSIQLAGTEARAFLASTTACLYISVSEAFISLVKVTGNQDCS